MSWRITIGFAVSMFGGDIVIRPLVRRLWKFVAAKHRDLPPDKQLSLVHTRPAGALSMPLGILERLIYTAAMCVGVWPVIAGWFVLKVAAKWKNVSEIRGADNVWLIGNALSLLFGFVGAWIALGHLPTFQRL